MDPYRILGVSRQCTREEVKETFRARVRHAHPDRGGTEEAFIRLCTAYQQILKELDQRANPIIWKPSPAARDGRPAVPPDRSWKIDRGVANEASGDDHTPRPPDPNWIPDLVVDDRPPPLNRLPVQPDPNWVPDLVVHDDGPAVSRLPRPADPGLARRDYISSLRRIADHIARRESFWQSSAGRTIGMFILLSILGGNLWLCWIAWTYDPERAAREADYEATRSQRAASPEVPHKSG